MLELHFLDFEDMQYLGCNEKVIYLELTDSIENVIYKIKQNMLKLGNMKIYISNDTNKKIYKKHKIIADCDIIDEDNVRIFIYNKLFCNDYKIKFTK